MQHDINCDIIAGLGYGSKLNNASLQAPVSRAEVKTPPVSREVKLLPSLAESNTCQRWRSGHCGAGTNHGRFDLSICQHRSQKIGCHGSEPHILAQLIPDVSSR
ncbi:hypothetical protein RRG08_010921 [Elysia crispata]|uniref:Uncharacterized protein n=1 Tax=Elysia crispata TaxID=231223 RepID=A0AAE0ZZT3_9GAST|nr:hypothetical protein RRG08_010921 [Elysia crispata]